MVNFFLTLLSLAVVFWALACVFLTVERKRCSHTGKICLRKECINCEGSENDR